MRWVYPCQNHAMLFLIKSKNLHALDSSRVLSLSHSLNKVFFLYLLPISFLFITHSHEPDCFHSRSKLWFVSIVSVTRFGENLPFMQNSASLCAILKSLNWYWPIFQTYFSKFICYWASFHCYGPISKNNTTIRSHCS